MRRRTAALLALGAAALSGAAPASGGTDAVTKALAGRIAGSPVDCIDHARLNGPEIVDSRNILYRESNRRLWRAGVIGDCPALRPLSTLVIDIYGGRLCRGDTFRVLEPGSIIPGGYCRFDGFTPYDLAARR